MNEQTKKIILSSGVYALVILAVTALINRLMWSDVKAGIIEGIFCMVLAAVPFVDPRIRKVLASLSPLQKKIFGALVIVMISTQMMGSIKRVTFPFIPWDMFSETVTTSEVEFFEYVGVTYDGDALRLRPTLIFKSLGSGRIVTDMDNRMKFLLAKRREEMNKKKTDPDMPADEVSLPKELLSNIRIFLSTHNEIGWREQMVEINHMIIALGQMYNRQHHLKPLKAIEVVRGVLNIDNDPELKDHRATIWHTEIPLEIDQ